MARGVRPLSWPRAGEPGEGGAAPPPPPAIAGWFDGAAFVGRFGPELSRTVGARLSLRRIGDPGADRAVPLVPLGAIEAAGRSFVVELDRATIAALLERMFGAPNPAPHDLLAGLSPASGSWKGLAHLVGEALASSLAEAGAGAGRFTPARRIGPARPDPDAGRLWFALDLAGAAGWLALAGEERPVPAAVPAAAPAREAAGLPADNGLAAPGPRRAGLAPAPAAGAAWRERAGALARHLDVTVGARIAEIRLPLETLLRLEVGAILPIERPRLLMLTVDGVPFRPLETPEHQP